MHDIDYIGISPQCSYISYGGRISKLHIVHIYMLHLQYEILKAYQNFFLRSIASQNFDSILKLGFIAGYKV